MVKAFTGDISPDEIRQKLIEDEIRQKLIEKRDLGLGLQLGKLLPGDQQRVVDVLAKMDRDQKDMNRGYQLALSSKSNKRAAELQEGGVYFAGFCDGFEWAMHLIEQREREQAELGVPGRT